MSILVFGSINMDLVAQVPRIPAAAETLTGRNFFTAPGGKGANQAVAAAKLGATTAMVGRVGSDLFGTELRDGLRNAGVDIRGVATDPDTSSGVALIAVDDAAQNSIIVVPGANGRCDQTELDQLETRLPASTVLLLQLEIPLDVVQQAAALAAQHDATVVLDPAPAQELPESLYQHVDILTPNEIEAAQLVGFSVQNRDDAALAAEALLGRGVRHAAIKLGARGVLLASADQEPFFVEPYAVTAVDSTAAGDAFNGALGAALSRGEPLRDAVRWGAAAGALATTKRGAQGAMPTLDEVRQLLNSR